MKAHVDWIIAFVGVRQGHLAPEERSHERPLAWKVVPCAAAAVEAAAAAAVKPVAAALWHHVD